MVARRKARKKRRPHQRLRRLFVLCCGFLMIMDRLLVERLRPGPWTIDGHCNGCGLCCTQILLHLPWWARRRPGLARLYVAAIHLWTDFRWTGREVRPGVLVFRCDLLEEDGRCGDYRLRPWICRLFPRLLGEQKPQFLDGCSYYARRRDRRVAFDAYLRRHEAAAPPTPAPSSDRILPEEGLFGDGL